MTQLRACGLGDGAIAYRVRQGRFIRQYRGVYAVGHAVLRPEGHRLAAVLACGPGAALGFRSAAAHFGLRSTSRSRIEVVVPRGHGGGPAGIHVHCVALAADDILFHEGIPTTSLARTVVDTAAVVRRTEVEPLVEAAIAHPQYDQRAMERALDRPRPGVPAVRRVFADRHPDAHLTRSELERAALRLIDRYRLPRPSVNVWLADPGCDIDLLWGERRLAVLLDGYRFHSGRDAFERDRYVDRELRARGYHVLRFTWRDVCGDSASVARHLARALQESNGRGSTFR